MIKEQISKSSNVRVQELMTVGKTKSLKRVESTQQIKANHENEESGCFATAQQFFHQNIFSSFVSMLSGLYCLMFIPSIVKVLHTTGKSDSPKSAFIRKQVLLSLLQKQDAFQFRYNYSSISQFNELS